MNVVYQSDKGTIVNGDCFDVMQNMNNCDLIVSDIPYGTTDAKWERGFDRIKFLENCLISIKKKRAVILFCNKPHNAELVYKFKHCYRHDFIWQKEQNANPFMVKHMPARVHEEILVFGKQAVLYNPQKELLEKPRKRTGGKKKSTLYNLKSEKIYNELVYDKYPISIRQYTKDSKSIRFHPTQKPIALLEFIIKSYSNEGDTVYDFTAGSCSLAIAAMNTGRKFFCVEQDMMYIQKFLDLYQDIL